ncbi:MAG: COG4315 family predicted lipoprotein [Anaerolineales bacterium]
MGFLDRMAVTVILTTVLSACSPAAPAATSTEVPRIPSATGAAPPTVESEQTQPASGYEDSYGLGDEGPSATSPATEAPLTLDAAETSLGLILVDSEGFALYILTSDTPNSSSCSGGCAQNWPPVLVVGEVIPGAALDPVLIGMLDRGGGVIQVTYAGWPLYRFAGDDAPGEVTGQGRGGVWFVLRPSGEVVR